MPRVGRVYRATQAFETSVGGSRRFVHYGDLVKEGDPVLDVGYFELVSDVFDDEPVEQATAAPGEVRDAPKRKPGRPRKTKADD